MKLLTRRSHLYFITLLLICAPTLKAQIFEIPLASQAAEKQQLKRPQTGMSTAEVKAQFGEPHSASQAVGTPPISRWVYQDFYVFFEYDHVIHSVLKHHPKNL